MACRTGSWLKARLRALKDRVDKRIISFSLWGQEPRYTTGAIRNAALALRYYPGWVCRFTVGSTVPAFVIRELEGLGSQVIQRDEPGDWAGLFWRYAAVRPEDEVVVFRDTDGRPGEREQAAVAAWLASGHIFHIMRDHPQHRMPILGGMWGVRVDKLPDRGAFLRDLPVVARYNADQLLLARAVYPRTLGSRLVHDEFFDYESDSQPFPTPRREFEFVGEIFTAADEPSGEREEIRAYLARFGNLPPRGRAFSARLARKFRLLQMEFDHAQEVWTTRWNRFCDRFRD
jgi:protein O-GlcNAc transferase